MLGLVGVPEGCGRRKWVSQQEGALGLVGVHGGGVSVICMNLRLFFDGFGGGGWVGDGRGGEG